MPENPLGTTADSIMPAFKIYHTQAAIIGRLLAGYGELEYELSICLGVAIDNKETALRTLFRVRGERQRIQTADALMRNKYITAGLENHYCEAIGAINWCRTCRNQYAHCHWWDDENALYFINLETSAKKNGPIMIQMLHLDISLLQRQEAFFRYTERLLGYINHEYELLAGKLTNHSMSAPKRQPRPKLYNPPGTYPPPKLGSDSQTPLQEDPEEGR